MCQLPIAATWVIAASQLQTMSSHCYWGVVSHSPLDPRSGVHRAELPIGGSKVPSFWSLFLYQACSIFNFSCAGLSLRLSFLQASSTQPPWVPWTHPRKSFQNLDSLLALSPNTLVMSKSYNADILGLVWLVTPKTLYDKQNKNKKKEEKKKKSWQFGKQASHTSF